MAFTVEALMAAEGLTQSEKRALVERFFPKLPQPDWQTQLAGDYAASKRRREDARRFAVYRDSCGNLAEARPYRHRHSDFYRLARAGRVGSQSLAHV